MPRGRKLFLTQGKLDAVFSSSSKQYQCTPIEEIQSFLHSHRLIRPYERVVGFERNCYLNKILIGYYNLAQKRGR